MLINVFFLSQERVWLRSVTGCGFLFEELIPVPWVGIVSLPLQPFWRWFFGGLWEGLPKRGEISPAHPLWLNCKKPVIVDL